MQFGVYKRSKSQKFFILTGKLLTQDELKDLNNLRFIAK